MSDESASEAPYESIEPVEADVISDPDVVEDDDDEDAEPDDE